MFRIELYGEILFGSRILFLKNSHTEKVLFEKLFLHKECDKRQWNRGDYGRWFKDILVEPGLIQNNCFINSLLHLQPLLTRKSSVYLQTSPRIGTLLVPIF